MIESLVLRPGQVPVPTQRSSQHPVTRREWCQTRSHPHPINLPAELSYSLLSTDERHSPKGAFTADAPWKNATGRRQQGKNRTRSVPAQPKNSRPRGLIAPAGQVLASLPALLDPSPGHRHPWHSNQRQPFIDPASSPNRDPGVLLFSTTRDVSLPLLQLFYAVMCEKTCFCPF